MQKTPFSLEKTELPQQRQSSSGILECRLVPALRARVLPNLVPLFRSSATALRRL